MGVDRTHQGGADGVHDRHARVDVGDQLTLALRRVRALAEQHDLGLLRGAGEAEAGTQKRRGKREGAGHESDPAEEKADGSKRRQGGRGGGGGRSATYDHLPVGQLHQWSRHGLPGVRPSCPL